MASQGSRSALGTFLRNRRDRLSPDDVSLPISFGPRRTPGLRREEVAALAGISVDYYIRLERGIDQSPSTGVIDALARALNLEEDEYRHLNELVAQSAASPISQLRTRSVGEPLMSLLEALRPTPAFITNRLGDLLACNPSALHLLMPGIEDFPEGERNMVRYAFLHPDARTLYADWEAQVLGLVHGLRRLQATGEHDEALTHLITDLTARSPEFVKIWDRYDIHTYSQGRLDLNHPLVGALNLSYQVLRLDGTQGLTMMVCPAPPGSPELRTYAQLDPSDETPTFQGLPG